MSSSINQLASGGSNYSIAERFARDPINIGFCSHSSTPFKVDEVEKVDVNKVKPGFGFTQSQIESQGLYPDAQFFYAGGVMFFVSTVRTTNAVLLNYNTGRDLFLVQSVENNARTLGDWAQDI